MKYRRIPSKKRRFNKNTRQVRCIDRERRLRRYWYRGERGERGEKIDFSALFEQNRLGNGKKISLKERIRARMASVSIVRKRIFAFLSKTFARVAVFFSTVFLSVRQRLRARREKRRKEPSDLPMLAGALTACLAVALLSAVLVLYKLLFSDFFGSYQRVVVPDMVGMSYDEASELLGGDFYDVSVAYEYSSSVPSGEIISQTPDGGAERKVFKRGVPCTVSVVVSRGKKLVFVPELVSKSARDATLELKNAEFSVAVIEEDSSSLPAGKVISTTPAGGELLESGGLVILHVSRSKNKTMLLVPKLCGLSEHSALAKIRAAGFSVGEIEYRSSKEPAGIVISQDRIALTKSSAGGKISVTVSAGETYLIKKVPSLYGLSVDEARESLAEYGLVVGNVYAAESNEPSGTVFAQSPSADTPISADIVSVDMYVSE